MTKSFLSLLCLLCFSTLSFAQLTIAEGNNITLEKLLYELIGEGATVQNVKIRAGGVDISTMSATNATSARQMYGLYHNANIAPSQAPNSMMIPTGADQITKGVVLSSGNVKAIPNISTKFASEGKNFGGDPHIIVENQGFRAYDAISIEFDVYPKGDLLGFNYTFASEEYPQFSCSYANDQFRLLITGINPINPNQPYNNLNMAVLPNTPASNGSLGTMVSINNVHSGGPKCNPPTMTSNVAYHDSTASAFMVFNQRTKGLYAQVPVVPNQKYTLYMVLADLADPVFDSGVFIEKIMAPTPKWLVSDSLALSQAQGLEGIEINNFKLKRPNPAIAETFTLDITGTAEKGIDYELYDENNVPITDLSTYINFVQEETEKRFKLKIKTDNEEESNETIKLNIKKKVGEQMYTLSTFEYTILGSEAILSIDALRKDKIEIYPNPTQDNFWVKSYGVKIDKVALIDASGKAESILNMTLVGQDEYEMSLKDVPKGAYVVKIWIGNEVVLKRIVKE